MHIKTTMAFRRVSTPIVPMANTAADTAKYMKRWDGLMTRNKPLQNNFPNLRYVFYPYPRFGGAKKLDENKPDGKK
jgi:hypothetical protein